VRAEQVEAALGGGPDREQRAAEPARRPRPGGGDLGRHRHLEAGPGVGKELQPGVAQGEPVGLTVDGLAGQQGQDGLQALLHHVPLATHLDAHHEGVRRQRAGAATEHDPAPRQVVEQHHPVGEHQRVVVGQRADAGPEPDPLGAFGRHCDEDLGGGDDLVTGRVVLADPGLVEPQPVEVLDQLQVLVQREGRVLPHGVERSMEDAEAQGPVHRGMVARA
jgi:hypothetical protein